MDAKWGRFARMAAVAALGLALSACGGGSSSGTAAASDSPAPGPLPAQGSATTQDGAATQGSAPAQGATSAQGSAPTQSPAPAQGTSGTGAGTGTGANPPSSGTAAVTINWTPPTENTDGTTLENLSGYKIHYGTASRKYTETITVRNPGLAAYVISSLAPGTYYFSVTAYNSAGTESRFSSEVSAKVD